LHTALSGLATQVAQSDHEFWPDDISITDATLFDHAFILGPNQITDIYLLGLAVRHGGRLLTFDRGVPIRAVRGAEPRHLVVV
jgi:predicted nucleic acid-binding protein